MFPSNSKKTNQNYSTGNTKFINFQSANQRECRECVISNYLPHPTPRNINREIWQQFYDKEIKDLFMIIKEILNNKFYDFNFVWDNMAYNNFSKMIYYASSKHINKNL